MLRRKVGPPKLRRIDKILLAAAARALPRDGYCVNLARIEQNVEVQDGAYEKLDQAISTTQLTALRPTFCPMEQHAMLRAALDIVTFYRERAPAVARAYGLTYPTELERLMCSRLDVLAGASG